MLQRAIAIIYLENKFVHKGAALIVKWMLKKSL